MEESPRKKVRFNLNLVSQENKAASKAVSQVAKHIENEGKYLKEVETHLTKYEEERQEEEQLKIKINEQNEELKALVNENKELEKRQAQLEEERDELQNNGRPQDAKEISKLHVQIKEEKQNLETKIKNLEQNNKEKINQLIEQQEKALEESRTETAQVTAKLKLLEEKYNKIRSTLIARHNIGHPKIIQAAKLLLEFNNDYKEEAVNLLEHDAANDDNEEIEEMESELETKSVGAETHYSVDINYSTNGPCELSTNAMNRYNQETKDFIQGSDVDGFDILCEFLTTQGMNPFDMEEAHVVKFRNEFMKHDKRTGNKVFDYKSIMEMFLNQYLGIKNMPRKSKNKSTPPLLVRLQNVRSRLKNEIHKYVNGPNFKEFPIHKLAKINQN